MYNCDFSDGVGTEEETFSVTENIAIDVSSSRGKSRASILLHGRIY